ncbi:MAG TPA: DUF4129 domain-containing protein [Thermoplasmata archaeon]|nr:DUF4129 domain-containing protein [Thermoplasmata archaeon]
MPVLWRTSPVLLCLVAVAVAIGAAGSLVASATRPYGLSSFSSSTYTLPSWMWGVVLVSPFVALFGAIVYRRMTEGGLKLPGSAIAFATVILAMLVLFAVLGSTVPSGGIGLGPSTSSSPPSGNSSKSPPPPTGGNGGTGPLGLPPVSSFHLPAGTYLAIALVVALGLVGLAVPAAWSAAARRRTARELRPDPAAVSAVQAALAGAASELSAGLSPRAVIEQLYLRLLARVAQVAGDVSGRTPEEIRADLLIPLGVRAPAADALTRLFEEARYSTHPMGADAATRVRSAVAAAASDLTRAVPAR